MKHIQVQEIDIELLLEHPENSNFMNAHHMVQPMCSIYGAGNVNTIPE